MRLFEHAEGRLMGAPIWMHGRPAEAAVLEEIA
jgi:hypothetical protein